MICTTVWYSICTFSCYSWEVKNSHYTMWIYVAVWGWRKPLLWEYKHVHFGVGFRPESIFKYVSIERRRFYPFLDVFVLMYFIFKLSSIIIVYELPTEKSLQMKGRWESNINVWFRFVHSQRWNFAALLLPKKNYKFCLPISTFVYLW